MSFVTKQGCASKNGFVDWSSKANEE